MMPWFGSGCFGNLGWFGMMISFVIMIVAIVGIIWLLSRFVRRSETREATLSTIASLGSPREILQVRYARGEITREQYLDMLNDLN